MKSSLFELKQIQALKLQETIDPFLDSTYSCHSRVHRLSSFDQPEAYCYVKRDDELGFGISGSKIRKYSSLIPFLLRNDYKQVILIGSAYSNHILSIVQVLIEHHLQPILFLKGDPKRELQGNLLLTRLFIPFNFIHWFNSSEWVSAEKQAQAYAQQEKLKTFVLLEGGSCSEALPGALTLPLDLLKNEIQIQKTFDHVFIDSGTGLMASALILGSNWMNNQTVIHVLLLAGTAQFFLEQLKSTHEAFNHLLNRETPLPTNFILHTPQQLRSFGSTNQRLFQEMIRIARTEGFLTDPIYTAKLFTEARQIIQSQQLRGHVLINHSGGGLTLTGFQSELKEALNTYEKST